MAQKPKDPASLPPRAPKQLKLPGRNRVLDNPLVVTRFMDLIQKAAAPRLPSVPGVAPGKPKHPFDTDLGL